MRRSQPAAGAPSRRPISALPSGATLAIGKPSRAKSLADEKLAVEALEIAAGDLAGAFEEVPDRDRAGERVGIVEEDRHRLGREQHGIRRRRRVTTSAPPRIASTRASTPMIGVRAKEFAGEGLVPGDPVESIHDVVADDAGDAQSGQAELARERRRTPRRGRRIGGAEIRDDAAALVAARPAAAAQTAAQARIAARARIGAARAQAGHEGAFRQAFEHNGIRGSGTRERDGGVDPVSGEAGAAGDRLGHALAAASGAARVSSSVASVIPPHRPI